MSASSIVADTTEGYHILTIRDYSRTKGVPTGERIGSVPFTVGGHRWRIYYFPNGIRPEVADYVFFSLELDEDAPAAVKAQVKFCFAGEEEEEAEQAGSLALASVEGMEVEVFKALLDFAYTGRLPQPSKEDAEVTCQRLLVAADRYGIVQLKLLCEEWMCKYIDVGTAATILALAEQNHCEGLKKACFDFLATQETEGGHGHLLEE
ncbi:hypothetical protein CFC21_086370 [Triticum aestivum]|uniref:MATH domain-containing protein n=2 Tax=Triticum aestivum TaxID=4565 RepID=A0A9R1IFU6_WHEAT|nr:hypothetical protein CFC21_086370 [Triticum aestivum]